MASDMNAPSLRELWFALRKSEPVNCSGVSEIGWCVGYNTTHLAKLPHFPSFLSLFLARPKPFDVNSTSIKMVSKLTITQKSGVLVRTIFFFWRLCCSEF